MEERRSWLKSGLQFFNIHPSPNPDNKSFASFEKEGCKSSRNSKSESDKCHSDMKQNRADNGLLWETENTGYDEQIMNLHVTHLEEEIIKLKDQVEKSENQVDDLSEKLKSKEEELCNLKEFSEKEISKSESDKCLRLLVFLLVLFQGSKLLVFSPWTLFILIVLPCVLFIYIKLKDQDEKRENQVDQLSEELKLKEEELHNLKEFSDKEIYKLKAQIEESEAKKQVHEISNLVEQLEMANEKLKTSEDENAVLRKELESKACEAHQLQGQLIIEAEENMADSDLELVSGRKHIQILENLVMIYEQEVQNLKSEMVNSQDKFSLEKDELHFDIASLFKTKIELTATLADCEFRKNELEGKLRKSEAEKLKQEELHANTQEELGWRLQDLEAITKELCMVMIERDEANVKIDRLEAEICTLKIDRSGYL